MSEQYQLFETAVEDNRPPQPRCRMCPRPATWIKRRRVWGRYCGSGGSACDNSDRICQFCNAKFILGTDPHAGTKYCSVACRRTGNATGRTVVAAPCAWCEKMPPDKAQRGGIWPYICDNCLRPIRHVTSRLKQHRVPHEMARRLLTDPSCEICGMDLLERHRQAGGGKVSAVLVVDHDHQCCPVDRYSCGKCVRGLICRTCNMAAGLVYESSETARSLAAYLEKLGK